MRRQRVLERVGWRFGGALHLASTAIVNAWLVDLLATLERFGIEPLGRSEEQPVYRFTERRVIECRLRSDNCSCGCAGWGVGDGQA